VRRSVIWSFALLKQTLAFIRYRRNSKGVGGELCEIRLAVISIVPILNRVKMLVLTEKDICSEIFIKYVRPVLEDGSIYPKHV
jgi:hypothetical protein